MEKYVLPKAPFRKEEVYVRGGKRMTAVRGRNDRGFLFAYDEHDELIDGMVARDVPVALTNGFDEYGTSVPALTTWITRLYLHGKYIKDLEGSTKTMETSHSDMVFFGAYLGEDILISMFNGKIRCLDGYDEQPLFKPNPTTGKQERVPDTTYDTTWVAPEDQAAKEMPYKLNHPVPVIVEEDGTL